MVSMSRPSSFSQHSPAADTQAKEELLDAKIRLKDLTKTFRTKDGQFQALQPLNLDINKGEFCAIVGPSGCGKTTLLRIFGGLETVSSGELHVEHEDPNAPLTSIIFQEESIFPWMTVEQNISYGLENRRVPKAERREIVSYWTELVGLSRFRKSFPHQLSGGMKQRVSVARAFANNPECLLMDEPFSALDEQNRTILHQELLRLWEHARKTVVFVTHSVDEALVLSDYILLMTAAPGQFMERIAVPFERPRDVLEIRADPRYGELQQRIWSLLIDEVDTARNAERQGS